MTMCRSAQSDPVGRAMRCTTLMSAATAGQVRTKECLTIKGVNALTTVSDRTDAVIAV
jgi:hypothetical protein